MEIALHIDLNLRETMALLPLTERNPHSRFRFGSPCRFIRFMDIVVHIVLPELTENHFPRLTNYLRSTSPRWGRSWRDW